MNHAELLERILLADDDDPTVMVDDLEELAFNREETGARLDTLLDGLTSEGLVRGVMLEARARMKAA